MTTTTSRPVMSKDGTDIIAHSDVPAVTITREFAAGPDKLFRAYTEPELVAQWLGPKSLEMRIDTWDCSRGGKYLYTAVREDEEYAFYGSFHDVRPDRIVQTWTYEGFPDAVSLETVYFEDLGDGRTLVRSFSLVESFEARDGMLSSGMEVGIFEGYEKLDAILAELA